MKLMIDFKKGAGEEPFLALFIGSVREIADMLVFPEEQQWKSERDFVKDVKTKFSDSKVSVVNRVTDSMTKKINAIYD